MRKKSFAALFTGTLLSAALFSSSVSAASYTVRQGDTLWKIAVAHEITLQQLMELNPAVQPMQLYPGQVLKMPDPKNVYTVQPGDVYWKIALKTNVPLPVLIRANPQIANPNVLNVGEQIRIPEKPPAFQDGVFPLKPGTYDPYVNNYAEARTWSPSGQESRSHEGVDIFAKKWTPVYSASEGTIINIGWNQYGGWRLTIKTGDSTAFYYAHLAGYAEGMKKGGTVKKGQLIGYVGSTGYGPEGTEDKFLPHLHFGIYNTDTWTTVDPYVYLKWWELSQE